MTLFSSQPGDEGLPGPARARVMAAIMTTTLMGVFDGTMINIALPSMAQEMQVPASIAVWFRQRVSAGGCDDAGDIRGACGPSGLSPRISGGPDDLYPDITGLCAGE